MKLYAALLVGLVVCELAATAELPKADGDNTSDDRKARLLFGLGNILSAPGNLVTSISNAISGIGKPATPQVIYVAKTAQSCTRFFTTNCPAGYVCDLDASTGKLACLQQRPDGFECQTGFQCLSGVCRERRCVRDECSKPGEQSTCPAGEMCFATTKGYRCQKKPDECPNILQVAGCNENHYCGSGTDNNICKPKRSVGESCSYSVQCLSAACRNKKCKLDACPTVDTSIDCMSMQYCAPSENGNVCVAKKEKGSRCSSSGQCKDSICQRGTCIHDECPQPYTEDRCMSSQFCSPGTSGNTCMAKRNTKEACQRNVECMSNTCKNGRCVVDQCPIPLMPRGCNAATQYCMYTKDGNICAMKLPADSPCTMGTECMTGRCENHKCVEAPASPKPNGQPCARGSECASTFCVLGNCAATQMGTDGMCAAATDCQSMICTNMRCAAPTTSSPTTGTSSSSTTTSTTTTTTTTAATTLAPGNAACTMNTECQSGRCLANVCTTAFKQIGETCTVATGIECLSNRCAAAAGAPAGAATTCMQGQLTSNMICTHPSQCTSSGCKSDGRCV